MGCTLCHRYILWIFIPVHRCSADVLDAYILVRTNFCPRDANCTLVHSSTWTRIWRLRKKGTEPVCPAATHYFDAYDFRLRALSWLLTAVDIIPVPVALRTTESYTLI